MKLFKSLLVAPAALGLLAPISASASEVNLNDISNYSDVESIDFANSLFTPVFIISSILLFISNSFCFSSKKDDFPLPPSTIDGVSFVKNSKS